MNSINNKINTRDTLRKREDSVQSFSAYNGITITKLEKDVAEGELIITPQSLNSGGIVHGGCLATLADTVAGNGVASATGHMCVTVNYSFHFLSPAFGDGHKIYCRAVPQKIGHTLCLYGVSLTDDNGREVAAGSFTFFLKEPL
ncbi:PaaI family thioesterase [Clostridium minihomine]|uniref:PaaI family thioesterase n=1 Tax=Clostridium minihomine TaxID=2045012 RepID=UPI000C761D58|nr:PaaI family thioesterase [Clostridium minihomine]